MRYAMVIALLSAACSRSTPTIAVSSIEAGDQAASDPIAPSKMTAPVPQLFAGGVATFTKADRLDECAYFQVTAPLGYDAGADDDFMAKVLEKMLKGAKGLPAPVRIYKPCDAQFQETPVLATCKATTETTSNKCTFEIESTEQYYDLDQLQRSDAYMRDCLKMNGDWQAAEHDSDEYQEAVRARARRNVQKIVDKYGR
jgi:hypothetical protein